MLKLFTFTILFYLLHHVRVEAFVIAALTRIEIFTIMAVIPRSYYRRAITDVTFIVFMHSNQRVEFLDYIIFGTDSCRFSRKSFRLVQILTSAGSHFIIHWRSNARRWFFASSSVDSVCEVSSCSPNITTSYIVFGVKIIAKVIDFFFIAAHYFLLLVRTIYSQFKTYQIFEELY